MPRVRVLAQAARELEEAAKWYEAEYAGLGTRLLDEFQRAVQLLREDVPPLLPVPGDAGRHGAIANDSDVLAVHTRVARCHSHTQGSRNRC